MLVDLTDLGVTGKAASATLERAGMTANQNTIPFDTRSALVTSGVRLGTPALTTRGMKEEHMGRVAKWVASAVKSDGDEALIDSIRSEISEFCADFPYHVPVEA